MQVRQPGTFKGQSVLPGWRDGHGTFEAGDRQGCMARQPMGAAKSAQNIIIVSCEPLGHVQYLDRLGRRAARQESGRDTEHRVDVARILEDDTSVDRLRQALMTHPGVQARNPQTGLVVLRIHRGESFKRGQSFSIVPFGRGLNGLREPGTRRGRGLLRWGMQSQRRGEQK